MRSLARSAFFLSGIAGLTFEILWIRHLGLAIGATTLAVATTTAVYMGGLALGSHLGGKLADRLRRPLSLYGALEIGIALIGLLIPWLCTHIPIVDEILFSGLTSGFGRALVRFGVASLVLIAPTTAMGLTLPILAKAVAPTLGTVGKEVGLLYALNIAGAMLGAALSGFVWIPTYGLQATNLIAVGIDLGLGAMALVSGLFLPTLASPNPIKGQAQIIILRPGGRLLIGMLAVTGAAAMALQVLWTRALSIALGPSTYAFSAIVCTYLAGLAIGGFLAARVADQVQAVRFSLAVILWLTGLAALFGIVWIDDLPGLLHGVVLDTELTMGGLVRTEFALAALALLPATIGMGAIFPLTLSAIISHPQTLGGAVGKAYALNTLGAILGSFAGVFILLPLAGVEWGMRLAALAYIGLALLLTQKLEPSVTHPWRRWLQVGVLTTGIAMVLWPGWDIARWTVGLYRLSMARAFFPDQDFEPSKVIFHRDGLASTVTVEEDGNVRWIKVNGKIDGSSEGDMPTQVLSGLLPMLIHPQPRQVAVIGCGSCVTVGAALQGNPDHLTLIELERQVVEAAKLFAEVNHAPWTDPRVSIVEDDGRNFLARQRNIFDVIISEPSNPWMTGAASLFTLEFFQTARRRLATDGLFVQWLQIYELAPERIASVLKTFKSVFPYVIVFNAHPESNDLLLVGSGQPLMLSWQRLQTRFVEMQAELAKAKLHHPEQLLALLLFTHQEFDQLPTDVPLNRDDNVLIEFGAPRDLLAFAEQDPDLPLLEALQGHRATIVRQVMQTDGLAESTFWLKLAMGYLHQGMLHDTQATADKVRDLVPEASPEDSAQAQLIGDLAHFFEEADRERVADATVVQQDAQYAEAVKALLAGEEDKALEVFEKHTELQNKSGLHTFLYGYLLYRHDQFSSARTIFLKAQAREDMQPYQTAITYYLARAAYEQGHYEQAIELMTQYRNMIELTKLSLSTLRAEE